jgi:hypothetical protein
VVRVGVRVRVRFRVRVTNPGNPNPNPNPNPLWYATRHFFWFPMGDDDDAPMKKLGAFMPL